MNQGTIVLVTQNILGRADDGFVFAGATEAERLDNLLARLREALRLLRNHRRKREALRRAARAARFPWADAARAYVEQLYR